MKQIFCLVLLLYTFALTARTLAKPSDVNRDSGVHSETGSGVDMNDGEQNTRETVRGIDHDGPTQDIEEIVVAIRLNEAKHRTKETDREIHSNEAIQNNTETVNGIRATDETRIHSNYTVQNITEEALLELSKRLLREFRANPYYSYPSGLSCTTCNIFIEVLREFWTGPGITRLLAKHFSISACISLRIQHPDVCIGIIREYENEFYYIFENARLSSHGICSALLDKPCGDENVLDKPWSVTLPDTQKPTVEEPSHIKVCCL